MNSLASQINIAESQADFSNLLPWRTIELGNYSSVEKLCTAMEATGCKIKDSVPEIRTKEHITIVSKRFKLNLYLSSSRAAGLDYGRSWYGIRKGLRDYGYDDCPGETGPQLARVYGNRPFIYDIWVLMRTFNDDLGDPHMFKVGHNRQSHHLTSGRCFTDDLLLETRMIVCCKRDDLVRLGLVEPF